MVKTTCISIGSEYRHVPDTFISPMTLHYIEFSMFIMCQSTEFNSWPIFLAIYVGRNKEQKEGMYSSYYFSVQDHLLVC